MRAVWVRELCGPEGVRIEEVARPAPGPGEVLARVHCAGLNFPDLLKIAGKHHNKPELPFAPGSEFAGIVEAVGPGVTRFKPGERVFAHTGTGAFAEYIVVPEARLEHTPEGMPDEDAAVFSLVYQTSYIALMHRARLAPGETVLVHSAAGGVGLAAVQIARAKGAGRIIGTVGSDEKRAAVLEQGADAVVNYRAEDFVEVVKKRTAGRGADVVYDPVGGEVTERSTKCIAPEGRILIVGFTSGSFATFRSNHLLVKNYSVMGLVLGRTNAEARARCWQELLTLYREGRIKPVICREFSMENIGDAMKFLESRAVVGKVLMRW